MNTRTTVRWITLTLRKCTRTTQDMLLIDQEQQERWRQDTTWLTHLVEMCSWTTDGASSDYFKYCLIFLWISSTIQTCSFTIALTRLFPSTKIQTTNIMDRRGEHSIEFIINLLKNASYVFAINNLLLVITHKLEQTRYIGIYLETPLYHRSESN